MYQSGWLETDDGTRLKVTVWQKSKKAWLKPTLRVGDRVRLDRAKVSRYNGEPSLAIDGDATVTRLERGDGEAPRHGTARGEVEHPTWSADSRQHAWINEMESGPDSGRDVDFKNMEYTGEGVDELELRTCQECGKELKNLHGVKTHIGMVHDE